MRATGLGVFDKTLQTTNIRRDEIMAKLGPERQLAWHALGAVLHALRDRLQSRCFNTRGRNPCKSLMR